MEPEQHDVIVIGAGIAGLSAAWDLRDRDVVVLERANRVGGRIRSESRGDLWLNLGAHVYAGDTSAAGTLMHEVGAEPRDIPGVLTGVSYKGKLVAEGPLELYPFKLPISLGGRASFVRTGLKLRKLVAEYGEMAKPRPGEEPAALQQRMLDFMDDQSFTQKLGVLQPEVDAFFRCTLTRGTGEPEQIAAGYGVGYFHLAWNQEDGLGRNIVGGPQTLIDGLAAPHGDRIRFGVNVTRVAQDADGVAVECDDNGRRRTLRAKAAIITTPSHVTAEIVVLGIGGATEPAAAPMPTSLPQTSSFSGITCLASAPSRPPPVRRMPNPAPISASTIHKPPASAPACSTTSSAQWALPAQKEQGHSRGALLLSACVSNP
jgi:oxygen-dependent protoporphyrinogen oxidase